MIVYEGGTLMKQNGVSSFGKEVYVKAFVLLPAKMTRRDYLQLQGNPATRSLKPR
jgi:hypothetical protein